MGLNIKEIGKKINSMGKEEKPGLMELLIMEIMLKEKSTDKENLHGLTGALMKDNSLITI